MKPTQDSTSCETLFELPNLNTKIINTNLFPGLCLLWASTSGLILDIFLSKLLEFNTRYNGLYQEIIVMSKNS